MSFWQDYVVDTAKCFTYAWQIITAKDPCKKCIVKACCRKKCRDKELLENLLYPTNSLLHAKILFSIMLAVLAPSIGVLIYGGGSLIWVLFNH